MMSRQTLRTLAISKAFRGHIVVRAVSLHVWSGEIVGLLGPNGAGKTTTFAMIIGLLRPDKGAVYLNEIALTGLPMHRRARLGIGYLPQEPSIFRKMTVEENLWTILEMMPGHQRQRQEQLECLLAEFNLGPLRHVPGYALSGGERRRVELARVLASSPHFILLDEPFTGVDPIMIGELQKLIFYLKGKGLGILITDHRVRETLEITDRAYIMHEGEILHSGTPHDLVESHKVKQIYLGEKFSLDSESHRIPRG